MTTFTSVTPNLLVRDIERSTAFYRDVLGFTIKQTVPDAAPFVFVWLERDGVPVFLNDPQAVEKDVPARARRARPGGTATMFFVVTDVDALHARWRRTTTVVMPLKTQFYGMREFAVEDPDGHLLTFAERVSGVDMAARAMPAGWSRTSTPDPADVACSTSPAGGTACACPRGRGLAACTRSIAIAEALDGARGRGAALAARHGRRPRSGSRTRPRSRSASSSTVRCSCSTTCIGR